MAGCLVAMKLVGLAGMMTTSFSSAALTFAGQNYGAKKWDRIKKGGIQIPLISGIFTLSLNLIAYIFAKPFITIFTRD